MKLCNLLDIINRDPYILDILRKYKFVVYRFHQISTNRDYIGITRTSLYHRMFNDLYGHIIHIENSDDSELYLEINESGPNDFDIYLEKECSNLLDLSESEKIFIKKFNSYYSGFNKTKGGFIRSYEITNGEDTLVIKVGDAIPEGWKFKGLIKYENKNLKGRIIVSNGLKFKRIKPSDIDKYENLGYYESNSSEILGYCKGRVSVHKYLSNGKLIRRTIPKSELQEFLDNGFKRGLIKDNSTKGMKVINNGVIEKRIRDISDIPEGFSLGGLKNSNRATNKNRTYMVDLDGNQK